MVSCFLQLQLCQSSNSLIFTGGLILKAVMKIHGRLMVHLFCNMFLFSVCRNWSKRNGGQSARHTKGKSAGIFVFDHYATPVADFGGRAPPPHGPKCSQFHAVFGKIWQNHMLAPPWRAGAPSSRKSWIRP